MTDTAPLLTVEDLKRHQAERQAIDHALKDLDEKREILLRRAAAADAWMEAVRVILSAQSSPNVPDELIGSNQDDPPEPQAETEPVESSPKPLTEAIMELDGLENGLTSGMVIAALRKNPASISHISNLSKQVYTNLARLKGRGQLVKQGDRYLLPPKQNEPSEYKSEGSDSGPVNGSTPSLDFNPARTVQ